MSLKKDGFDIKGYEELMRNIEELGESANKEVNKALRSAAPVVQDRLEKNTPKGAYVQKSHAKNNVVISNVKTNRESGDKYISVGYPRGVSYRIHFIEFGTLRKKPYLHMTKTINDTKEAVLQEVANSLKKGLGLK